MITITGMTLSKARRSLQEHLIQAPKVRTERWQGVGVNQDTRELRNVELEVDLEGCEDLSVWRRESGANVPWADDHFLERVGGKAINPGIEWANWPWGRGAANFLSGEEELGPRMAPQDWAYLAGMIDGEGTIYYQKHKMPSFQGVVRVYQKDRTVLDYLHGLFKVGDVHQVGGQDQVLNGKKYDDTSHQWAVGAILEIRWLLTGVLPYLKVKSDAANTTLMAIETCLKRDKQGGAPLKKVWDQSWPRRFNHNYMDRLWPNRLEGGSEFQGHHWKYGNLQDLVEMLAKEPHTRQAYIPLFFPEDTGTADGGRKVCTLGYQFLRRDDRLHIWYPLRSCDFVHHFPDDAYLAIRLLLWVLDWCRHLREDLWAEVKLGTLGMHMTSLHIFEQDVSSLTDQ
jgi:hypothetical protein